MLIRKHGTGNWQMLANRLNAFMGTGQTLRKGKQCRERWHCALNPFIKRGAWKKTEEIKLLRKWLNIGNYWKNIADSMGSGRDESQCKNKFKQILRRLDMINLLTQEDQLRVAIKSKAIQILSTEAVEED